MGAGARLVDVVVFIPSLSSLTRRVERLSAITAEGALSEEFILMEEGKNFRGSPAEGATFESAVHGLVLLAVNAVSDSQKSVDVILKIIFMFIRSVILKEFKVPQESA